MKRLVIAALSALLFCTASYAAEIRSEKHANYASELWSYLSSADYSTWNQGQAIDQPFAPPPAAASNIYSNKLAAKTAPNYEYGSLIISENKPTANAEVASITVYYRVKEGFDSKRNDWYWAVFTPAGEVIKTSADKNPHDQRGYFVQEEDGRLWVFSIHSPELANFLQEGDLAKRVTRVGAGPQGETLMSAEASDMEGYVKAAGGKQATTEAEPVDTAAPDLAPANPESASKYNKEGFVTMVEDGRLWVFKAGSEELAAYKSEGDLAKRVTRVGAGPDGMTILAPDADTIDAYLAK